MPVQGTGNRAGRLAMHWAQVQCTQVPTGWIRGPNSVSTDDYVLLELRRPHRHPHMMLMAALAAEEMAGKRINFSGFDSDRLGKLLCCFCGGQDGPPHLPAL